MANITREQLIEYDANIKKYINDLINNNNTQYDQQIDTINNEITNLQDNINTANTATETNSPKLLRSTGPMLMSTSPLRSISPASIVVQEDIQEDYIIYDRVITPNEDAEYKNIVVTTDDSSNRVFFSMYKTFDDRTLIDKHFSVIWINAAGYKGETDCVDIQTIEDRLYFAWNIPYAATRTAGTIKYAIRITTKDYVWNTLPADIECVQGLMDDAWEDLPDAEGKMEPKLDLSFCQITYDDNGHITSSVNMTQAQLNALNSGVTINTLTTITDLQTTTVSLQNQIDNIISPVTQDAEVQNARIGVDSTSYPTLKNRLDSEYNILSEGIKVTNETVDEKMANITEMIGKTISSFTVGTTQHSSRSDMIPWNGKAGDTIYISISSSPTISPQRNGGVYTYLNNMGTEYGSILIDGTTPKAVTLLNDTDYIGIWIPALDEECEITVVVESEDSIFKSLDEVSDGLSSCESAIKETASNMSNLFGKTVSSFVVGTSQHSSRDDMIPWDGKAGDKIYVSVTSSPVLSPQKNGGIYTYLNDTGTAYGSILIDNSLPKEITLRGDIDHFGIWIPALAEEHEISVTIEDEDSVNNSLIKLSNESLINEDKIEALKNDLIGYDESDDLIWGSDFWNTVHVNQGGYISSDDGVSIISDNRYGYTDYIDISEYMLIKLLHNVSESVTHRIYVYDENKTYLSKTEVFSPTTQNPFIFTGYKHAKYMRFSITLSESDTYGLLAVNRIVYGADNIKCTNRSISASAKALIDGKIMSTNIINWDGMLTGTFVNSSNVETYFKEGLETGFMDVSDFNSIKIYLNPNLTRGRAVKFYDSSDNIVQYISLSATSEIAVHEDAVKMRMTIFGMTNDGYSDIPYIKFYGIYGSMDAFVSQPYQGKKISILGDSISTFSGWLYPSENVAFYTGNNAGVSAVSDTWWYKLITALGATLEKNNSWSGSAVSNCRGSYPKSGVQRCTNLGEPDVIIVRMGTNDFYFGAELGTYDGTTAIPTGETTFSDAFAKMLDMIMTTYKTAEIWVCTMTQFERLGNVGYPETNSHGETIAEWNERIRQIARALGAKILDDAMCGMTYQNIGVYTDDQPYETTGNGLHPNAAGMSLIANNCIRTMDASTRIRF